MSNSEKKKTADEKAKAAVKRPSRPPTSRFGRLARLTALAPKALPLAKEAVRRAVGKERSAEDEERAREEMLRSAKSTAEAMLKTLGDMKGLPLKLGQMASYIDGLAPPGYEERFQKVLAKLQAKAPPLSPTAAVKVVTQELGETPEQLFEIWEPEPFAAASIGQVHRARTRGGSDVAVKVQYPGIDKAIENDLKSLSMLETMVAPIARQYHSKEAVDEIKSVFMAELDYRFEAEMTARFRSMHEDDPDIVIPRVHDGLTTRRVITTELIGGQDYATFASEASQDERNRAACTIWRFMFKSLYGHGLLYADPHPGNYRFLGDGRVAFLDFGCIKEMPDELVDGTRRYITAAQDEDWERFERACIDVLGYDPTDEESYDLYIEYTKLVLRPIITRGSFHFTKAYARETVEFLVQGGRKIVFKKGSRIPNLPKPIHPPQDHTFMNRLQWGLASVLAGLDAEADFRSITDPWLRGSRAA